MPAIYPNTSNDLMSSTEYNLFLFDFKVISVLERNYIRPSKSII